MPCSFGHKDTHGLSAGLLKYLCPPHSCCTSTWAPTESEGVSSCLEPGRAGSQGPKGGGRRNDPEGTEAPGPGHMLCCPMKLYLQITNSKIMLLKFLRCQLQRMEPQAQWLNVVVCAIALINILTKLALQRDFLDLCVPVGSLSLHSHLSLLPGSALFSHGTYNCLNLYLFLIFPTRVQAP